MSNVRSISPNFCVMEQKSGLGRLGRSDRDGSSAAWADPLWSYQSVLMVRICSSTSVGVQLDMRKTASLEMQPFSCVFPKAVSHFAEMVFLCGLHFSNANG